MKYPIKEGIVTIGITTIGVNETVSMRDIIVSNIKKGISVRLILFELNTLKSLNHIPRKRNVKNSGI